MNQHVRISDLVIDGEAAEPSAKFRVAFAKAGAFACKFIIGEPDEKAICCGAPTDGKSWCAYHRRIVFEKRVHQAGRQPGDQLECA